MKETEDKDRNYSSFQELLCCHYEQRNVMHDTNDWGGERDQLMAFTCVLFAAYGAINP